MKLAGDTAPHSNLESKANKVFIWDATVLRSSMSIRWGTYTPSYLSQIKMEHFTSIHSLLPKMFHIFQN